MAENGPGVIAEGQAETVSVFRAGSVSQLSLYPRHLAKCVVSREVLSNCLWNVEWTQGFQETTQIPTTQSRNGWGRWSRNVPGLQRRERWDVTVGVEKAGMAPRKSLWNKPSRMDGEFYQRGFSFFLFSSVSHSSIHQPLDTGLSFPPPPFLPGFLPGLFLSSCLDSLHRLE